MVADLIVNLLLHEYMSVNGSFVFVQWYIRF